MPDQIQIVKLNLRKVAMPMHTSFKTAFGNLPIKETAIIELEDEQGNIGLGEASSFYGPVYTHEDVDTILYLIRKFLSPMVLGKSFSHPAEVQAAFREFKGHNIAKAGIEFAFWDLYAQRKKASFKTLFGGDKDRIKVKRSVGIKDSLEATLEEVNWAIDKKFQAIKIKIQPDWDLKLVAAIREQHPDLDLMVDGNSGYTYEEHLPVFKELDQFGLTMIEQPFEDEDLYYHSLLQKEIQTPVCLDESIKSVLNMKTAVALGACQIVNIKPARISGIVESLKVIELAQQNNMRVWVGGLLETGIGRAINIALASMPVMSMVNDISDYHEFFEQDLVTDSFVVEEGYVKVRDGLGLGYAPDHALIEQYTVEHYRLDASTASRNITVTVN